MGKTAIQVRVSTEQREQMKAKAKAAGMGLSEYIRQTVLGSSPAKSTPAKPKATPNSPAQRKELAKLVIQFRGRGMTTPVATREAKKQLGL